ADNPGIVANKGRMRVDARSLISSSLRPALLNTREPTGSDDASKRMTCGGKAPGGKKDIDLLSCTATCAEASAIFVLSKKVSFRILMPWIFLLVTFFMPFTYKNWSASLVEKKPSICCGVMPP